MPDTVRAWHPDIPSVREVLHATFREHAYPAHTHDDWTLLLIDDGAVTYQIDRTARLAVPASVTLLPPHIPHDGRSAQRGRSFRKRVIYLDEGWLPAATASASVERPTLDDPATLRLLHSVHEALDTPGDAMAAESGLLAMRDRILTQYGSPASRADDTPLARRLRALLDDKLTETFTLAEAAALLGAHPSHLVRAFSAAYGIPPHRYVTGRRVDRARHLVARGVPIAQAATEAGFHDQAHMTRHFRRVLGVTPGTFAA